MNKVEIERKFLIKKPSESFLNSLLNVSKVEIEQTYTLIGARVRKWTENGKVSYIQTVKKELSAISRIETEEEITEKEYLVLLSLSDPSRITLKKTRYRYPFGGKLIETDLFPFWENQAFLEVELSSETEEFSLPEFVEIIREVTSDKAFKNHAIAKSIPKEEV